MTAVGGWPLLVAAGLLEIVWALALKHSHGFSRPVPGAIAVVAAALSFGLLALALRTVPLSTGYAVWVGIGAAGVGLAGVLLLGETVSPFKAACLVLIGLGVVGLKMSTA